MHPYQITSQIAADRQADMRADAARRSMARQARDARRAAVASDAAQPIRPARRWRLAFLLRTTV
jgi:hypothetical protein